MKRLVPRWDKPWPFTSDDLVGWAHASPCDGNRSPDLGERIQTCMEEHGVRGTVDHNAYLYRHIRFTVEWATLYEFAQFVANMYWLLEPDVEDEGGNILVRGRRVVSSHYKVEVCGWGTRNGQPCASILLKVLADR